MGNKYDEVAGRRLGVASPILISKTEAPAATGTGKLLEIEIPVGFVCGIKGLKVTANTNQTITGIYVDSVLATNKFHNGATIGVSVNMSKFVASYDTGKYKIMTFFRAANTGAGTTKKMMEDLEIPKAMTLIAAFAYLETAPGGADTVKFYHEATELFTITGAAVKGENKALSILQAANSDFDISVKDSAGVGNGYTLTLIWSDGEAVKLDELPADIEDIYGAALVVTSKVIVEYTQAVGVQNMTVEMYGNKRPVLA